MPLALDYPAMLTDAEWKKVEKKVGVSATGVGKTLRDLEKAVKAFNVALGKVTKEELTNDDKTELAALTPLLNAARAAGKKAFDTVKATHADIPAGSKAKKHALAQYFTKTNRYSSELADFDLVDHRGLEWVVDDFNGRVGA